MVEKLSYGLVGKDLNAAAELSFDASVLIAKSAKKNIKNGQNLGNQINSLLDDINVFVYSDDNKDVSFQIYHRAALFKQLAQNVYHGSVIGAILDSNVDITRLIAIG